jgi:Uma2 family endonuclease
MGICCLYRVLQYPCRTPDKKLTLSRKFFFMKLKAGTTQTKSGKSGKGNGKYAPAMPGPSVEKPDLMIQTRSLGGYAELKYARKMTEAEFYRFCADNPELRIEQDKNGKLIILPPVEFDGSARENAVTTTLYNWWERHRKGLTLSPSAGFKLPDNSTRSADGSWVSEERLAVVSKEERKKFARIVPDFVVEVSSESDRIGRLKRKMTEVWIKNGVRLAWLIDPKKEVTYIYRADGSKDELSGFDRILSGEAVCSGLELDLRQLRF